MILPFAKWISRSFVAFVLAVPALGAGAASPVAASQPSAFPSIRVWSLTGAFEDGSAEARLNNLCQGLIPVPADSLRLSARALTVRFLRDRTAESRPDFGGYRIYRMINTPDSSRAMLIRRFSINTGSALTWGFSRVDSASGEFICPDFLHQPQVVHDSIATFIDPDSNGNFQKVCSRRDSVTLRCLDSTFVLVAPPGPHDGFKTWYSITYEKRNTTDFDYEDLFVPDTLEHWARCDTSSWYRAAGDTRPVTRSDSLDVRNTCPNLNHKLRNLTGPLEPSAGPTKNLEIAHAVPNPYRAAEAWDPVGQGEIHFINLPRRATIKIFTVAGDLVRVIDHSDAIRDFERWDLRNGRGNSIASGIYMYRIESGTYVFQDRLIVIR